MGISPPMSSGHNSPVTFSSTLQRSTPGGYQDDLSTPEYFEAAHSISVPTKTEDGNQTRGIEYIQNSDASLPGRRPGSSNSGPELPADDQAFLDRTTCTPDLSEPQEFPAAKLMQKPVDLSAEEVSQGFSFMKKAPNARRPPDEQLQTQADSQGQSPPMHDSEYAPRNDSIADQAPPSGQGHTLTSSYQATHGTTGSQSTKPFVEACSKPISILVTADNVYRDSQSHGDQSGCPNVLQPLDLRKTIIGDCSSSVKKKSKSKSKKSRRPRSVAQADQYHASPPRALTSNDISDQPTHDDAECIINITGSVAPEHMVDLGIQDTCAASSTAAKPQIEPQHVQHDMSKQGFVPRIFQPESVEDHRFIESQDMVQNGPISLKSVDTTVQTSLEVAQPSLAPPTGNEAINLLANVVGSDSLHPHGPVKALGDTLRSVSDRNGPAKVINRITDKSKSRSGTHRHSNAGTAALSPNALTSVGDVVQLLEGLITNEKRSALARAAAEIDFKDGQLRDAIVLREELISEFKMARDDLQNEAMEASVSYQTTIESLENERTELQDQVKKQGFRIIKMDERTQKLCGRAKQLTTFLNGVGADLGRLKEGYDMNFESVKAWGHQHDAQYHALMDGALQTVEKFSDFNNRNLTLTRDYQLKVQELTQYAEYLEKQLSEKVGMLTEERDLRATLENRLKEPHTEQTKLQNSLKECTNKVLDKLGALHRFVDERQKSDELVELIKKCLEETASLTRQGQASVKSVEGIRGLVEALSSATQKHFEESKAADKTGQADPASILEGRIVGLLEGIKTDLRPREDHAAEASTLRETIATLEERQKSNKGRIADLDTQIAEHNAQATTLRQHIQELELSNVSLQAEHNLLESVNTRLEEKTHDNEVLRQQLAKSKVEHVDATASLATYRDKLESLRGEKENLQQRLADKERELRQAQQVVPDFGLERAQLEDKARQDLKNLRAELGEQSRSRVLKLDGEIHQARLEKEASERRLDLARSELQPLKADNQLLREEAKNTSATKKIAALSADLESKELQIRKFSDGEAAERKKCETLQSTIVRLQAGQEASESSTKLLSNQVQKALSDKQETQLLLDQSESAKAEIEAKLCTAETDARTDIESHEGERFRLQRCLEEARSLLKEAQDQIAKQKTMILEKSPAVEPHASMVEVQASQSQSGLHQRTQNSQQYASSPASQDLHQSVAESSIPGATSKKARKKVDRNVVGHSQPSSNRDFLGASGAESQLAINESQQDEDMLLDHSFESDQRPGTRDTDPFVDFQGMEDDGLIESSPRIGKHGQEDYETQSPLKMAPQFSMQTATADDTQSQRGAHIRASSLLSERNVSSSHRIAAEQEYEESQQRSLRAIHAEGSRFSGPQHDPDIEDTQQDVSWSQDGAPAAPLQVAQASQIAASQTPSKFPHASSLHAKKHTVAEDTQSTGALPQIPLGPKSGNRPSKRQPAGQIGKSQPLASEDISPHQSSSPAFMSAPSHTQIKNKYSHKPKHGNDRDSSQQTFGQKVGSNKKSAMKRSAVSDHADAMGQTKRARLTAEPETPAQKTLGRPSPSTRSRSRQPFSRFESTSDNPSVRDVMRTITTVTERTRTSSSVPKSARKPSRVSSKASKMDDRFREESS